MRTDNRRTRHALTAGLLLAVAGCAGDSYPIEVTGSTGQCRESGTMWSGDPIAGALPGTVLERTVTCEEVTASDERVAGEFESSLRCVFAPQGERVVGDCVMATTVTNEGGTWHDDDGVVTITIADGAPAEIVQDGVRVGGGEYEGLSFTYHVEGTAEGYPWEMSGTIDRAG